MDWPDDSPDSVLVVGDVGDKNRYHQFDFDSTSEFTCRILQSDGERVNVLPLHSPQSWERWFQSSRVKDLRSIPSQNVLAPEGGYEILLSARASPISVGPPGRERFVEESLMSLPFAEKYWREVTQALFVHKSVMMVMEESLALSFSALFPTEIKGAEAEIYLASNFGGFPGRIAISSTHFINSKFTTAVIYGCDTDQMQHVTDLLRRSPDVRGHRLLSIGLFSELQRSRLERGVADFRYTSTGMMIEFGAFDARNRRRMSEDDHWWLNVQLREHRQVAIRLAEESRAAKAHLDTIMETLNESEPRKGSEAYATTSDPHNNVSRSSTSAQTKRFKRRFRDISLQYESLAGICQTQLDNMTFVRDFSMADYSAREAKATKALGLTAMIYLPITSLATIFAMPIFDWKARWLDFYMTFVPSSSLNDSAGSGSGDAARGRAADTTDPGATAVLSGYFWIYLGISLVTTMLTVAGYMLYAWNWRIPFLMRFVYGLMRLPGRIRDFRFHNLGRRIRNRHWFVSGGKPRLRHSGRPDIMTARHPAAVSSTKGIELVENKDVTGSGHPIHITRQSHTQSQSRSQTTSPALSTRAAPVGVGMTSMSPGPRPRSLGLSRPATGMEQRTHAMLSLAQPAPLPAEIPLPRTPSSYASSHSSSRSHTAPDSRNYGEVAHGGNFGGSMV
ncbi:hypothetical protein V8F20_001415 [Naviculisporaceae sp. PSN 640]